MELCPKTDLKYKAYIKIYSIGISANIMTDAITVAKSQTHMENLPLTDMSSVIGIRKKCAAPHF